MTVGPKRLHVEYLAGPGDFPAHIGITLPTVGDIPHAVDNMNMKPTMELTALNHSEIAMKRVRKGQSSTVLNSAMNNTTNSAINVAYVIAEQS